MVTESGLICDVCGRYILPITGKEIGTVFRVKWIDENLVYCNKCKAILRKASKSGDWKMLPDGPLRQAFEEAAKREP